MNFLKCRRLAGQAHAGAVGSPCSLWSPRRWVHRVASGHPGGTLTKPPLVTPEGCRILAGGPHPRYQSIPRNAPRRRCRKRRVPSKTDRDQHAADLSCTASGVHCQSQGFRGLKPPANFLHPSGVEDTAFSHQSKSYRAVSKGADENRSIGQMPQRRLQIRQGLRAGGPPSGLLRRKTNRSPYALPRGYGVNWQYHRRHADAFHLW